MVRFDKQLIYPRLAVISQWELQAATSARFGRRNSGCWADSSVHGSDSDDSNAEDSAFSTLLHFVENLYAPPRSQLKKSCGGQKILKGLRFDYVIGMAPHHSALANHDRSFVCVSVCVERLGL